MQEVDDTKSKISAFDDFEDDGKLAKKQIIKSSKCFDEDKNQKTMDGNSPSPRKSRVRKNVINTKRDTKINSSRKSFMVSQIGNEYSGKLDSSTFTPMQSVGSLYDDDGFYSDKEEDPIDPTTKPKKGKKIKKIELPPEPPVDLFLTQAEKDAAARKKKRLSHKIFIQSAAFGNLQSFFTIFSIFADDCKKWWLSKWIDFPFDLIIIAAFIGFSVEFICKIDLGRMGYVRSVPCVLDFLSTVSLIMDLALIAEDILAAQPGGSAADKAKFSRAGRASRIGTKVGRIVKIIRLLKLQKLALQFKKDTGQKEALARAEEEVRKALKKIQEEKKNKLTGSVTGDCGNNTENKIPPIDPGVLKRMRDKEKNDGVAPWFKENTINQKKLDENDDEDDAMELPKESKIGTQLTNKTLKKVILIVIFQCMVTPMFHTSYYNDLSQSLGFDVKQWGIIVQSEQNMNDEFQEKVSNYFRDTYNNKKTFILDMYLQDSNANPNQYIYWYNSPEWDVTKTLRNSEVKSAEGVAPSNVFKGYDEIDCYIKINNRNSKVTGAWMGILKTITICTILTVISLSFTNDFNGFIQLPVERLTAYLNTVMTNPLSLYAEYLIAQSDPKTRVRNDIIEYHYIQMGLMKISAYQGAAHGGRAVEAICKPLIQQKKDIQQCRIYRDQYVFVYVCIRNINEITEQLQEDSFSYINKILDIVGQVGDRYGSYILADKDMRYIQMWKVHMDEKTTQVHKLKQYHDYTSMALVTVLKSLCKTYRLIELMKLADLVTHRMIHEYINGGGGDAIALLNTTVKKYEAEDEIKDMKTDLSKINNQISNFDIDQEDSNNDTKQIKVATKINVKSKSNRNTSKNKNKKIVKKNSNLVDETVHNLDKYGNIVKKEEYIVDESTQKKKNTIHSNNIVVKGDGTINNRIIVDTDRNHQQGDKIIINNNIVSSGDYNKNGPEQIINNTIVINPYKSRNSTFGDSDLDINSEQLLGSNDTLEKNIKIPRRKLVTFSLHNGYSYEAVLGSIYKCNPYFSSGHINLARAFQKCNEIYDTSLIINGDTYDYQPECMKSACRLIDCAIIYQGGKVFSQYTVDMFPEEQQPFENIDRGTREARKKKQMVITQLINDNIQRGEKNALFLEEMDIQCILAKSPKDIEFQRCWRNAIDFYLVGNWNSSYQFMRNCQEMRPRDGPTIELYKYMDGFQWKSPLHWSGYRDLRERLEQVLD